VLIDANKLGLKIKTLRDELKLTQKELAEKLNLSFQAISKWENGDSYPDISQLVALAELFNVSIDSLILASDSSRSSVKSVYAFYETIDLPSIALSILNFNAYNGETRIEMSIVNKTKHNLPCRKNSFVLLGMNHDTLHPKRQYNVVYNQSKDDDDSFDVGLKHEITPIIPPNTSIIAVLYFDAPHDDGGCLLYPNVVSGMDSLSFALPHLIINGIDPLNRTDMIDKITPKNIPLYIEYLTFKKENALLMLLLSKQNIMIDQQFIEKHRLQFQPEDGWYMDKLLTPDAIEFLVKNEVFPNFTFLFLPSVNDDYKRKVFKLHYNDFESRCIDHRERSLTYVQETLPFMDLDIQQFLTKMWLKYGNKLISWGIHCFDDSMFAEMKEYLLRLDISKLTDLYNSSLNPRRISELIVEKANGLPLNQIVNLISRFGNNISNEFRVELFHKHHFETIESMSIMKPYLDRPSYETYIAEEISKRM